MFLFRNNGQAMPLLGATIVRRSIIRQSEIGLTPHRLPYKFAETRETGFDGFGACGMLTVSNIIAVAGQVVWQRKSGPKRISSAFLVSNRRRISFMDR